MRLAQEDKWSPERKKHGIERRMTGGWTGLIVGERQQQMETESQTALVDGADATSAPWSTPTGDEQ